MRNIFRIFSISLLFGLALSANPQEKLDNKYCDTFGKKSSFVLNGGGFHYKGEF